MKRTTLIARPIDGIDYSLRAVVDSDDIVRVTNIDQFLYWCLDNDVYNCRIIVPAEFKLVLAKHASYIVELEPLLARFNRINDRDIYLSYDV